MGPSPSDFLEQDSLGCQDNWEIHLVADSRNVLRLLYLPHLGPIKRRKRKGSRSVYNGFNGGSFSLGLAQREFQQGGHDLGLRFQAFFASDHVSFAAVKSHPMESHTDWDRRNGTSEHSEGMSESAGDLVEEPEELPSDDICRSLSQTVPWCPRSPSTC